jgi:hypothetical protein
VIVDYTGAVLNRIALPAPTGSQRWNGIMGSLTVEDIDGNGLLDVFGVTPNSGFVRYEVAGSASFRVAWGTGRGSYTRSGQAPASVRNG